MPLVSVIMPTFNSSAFVTASMESVLGQSFDDLELIVVDDHSSDDTAGCVRALAAQDGRVRFIQLTENSGPAVARNRAIQKATGRYIAFLDSDDLWLPGKLERQLAFTSEVGSAVTFTSYRKIDEDGTTTSNVVEAPRRVWYRRLLKSNVIACSTALYDTSVCGKVLMPEIRKRQDYALWLRILRSGHEAWGMPDDLVRYRVRAGSVSANKLSAARYHWAVYRQVEGLRLLEALYYFGHYVVISSLKFLK